MICTLNTIHYYWLKFLESLVKCTRFLSVPGLAWQTAWKKTEVELELLMGIDISLILEKGDRGGICHYINGYARPNNKYMKDYAKNKEPSYLQYWNLVNNLYGWAMKQHKLHVNGFKWVEDLSEFDEGFMKNTMKKVKRDIFYKLIFNIQKNCLNF